MAKGLTWQAVTLVGVIGSFCVALASIAHWGTGDVIAVAAVLASVGAAPLAGATAASGVQQRVEVLQAETSAQTETLQVLDRRTNGELDQRIEAGSRAAAELVLNELREQGVIR